MIDQKIYLDRVNHDARCFVNDEALASNCEGFGEGHFNLIASQICRAHDNNFKKAKDAIIQHFYTDIDSDLSNFKRRVLPLASTKGGASVDQLDNNISIATNLITDIITRIVEAPESEWPTPRPDLKGRQHSNKTACPWLVPTFCNQRKRPTEHAAQDTKIIDDCVDSTFMLPAAKETSAPSQAEERTAKSDIIERKCIIQMKATVTEEKMPTTKRPKKETKATKDINLFWSHAHGSLAYALFPDGYVGHENAPHNRVSAIGCNYPNCSCTSESQLCKLKCGHTACSQCIALKPAFTNDPMQTVGGSKKPRRSAAVDNKKKLKIEYIDDEAIPAVNEFPGCSLCNSKLMQRWARLAAVDIKSQGRKLTVVDIDKNGGNYVDYEHEHKAEVDNDSDYAESSTDDEEEDGAELASFLQNVPRKSHKKGEEMIVESKSRLRQLIK